MKLLIDDGMQIKVGTGIGKYSINLFRALQENTDINVEVEQWSCDRKNKKMKRLHYLIYINSSSYRKKTSCYDVIHYTNFAIPFIRNKKSKYIVTIHDLSAFEYPGTLSFVYGVYNRFIVKYSIRHADKIITVSDTIKKQIQNRFPKYKKKVCRIYPGLYSENKTKRYDQYDNEKLQIVQKNKFFLFTGTIEKRKNIGFIIDTFAELKNSLNIANEYKLVLAGRPGYGFEEFEKKVQDLNLEDDILFTGYISDEDKIRLYSNALAYVFPSLYEGFGSTITECMSYNLPLILSNIPTSIEVAGDYGVFFELENKKQLLKCMRDIVENKYDYIGKAKLAKEYLCKYDWETLALEYEREYRKLKE